MKVLFLNSGNLFACAETMRREGCPMYVVSPVKTRRALAGLRRSARRLSGDVPTECIYCPVEPVGAGGGLTDANAGAYRMVYRFRAEARRRRLSCRNHHPGMRLSGRPAEYAGAGGSFAKLRGLGAKGPALAKEIRDPAKHLYYLARRA